MGVGIKIGMANKSCIIRNEIISNLNGVEVVSADPFIFANKIEKNTIHGIYTYTYNDFRCDGRIKTNLSISGNFECGIFCEGNQNFTRIQLNSFIGYNKKAGIKVDNGARVQINNNKISKNLGQGILLVETSSAIVERNEISENIKANVALGGASSISTVIVENQILRGRCEGIYITQGGQCWINRNNIQENNDGIVIVKSRPEICLNSITKNKSNGVVVLEYSAPRLIDNFISDNDGIGLYIRENCTGWIKQNMVFIIFIIKK